MNKQEDTIELISRGYEDTSYVIQLADSTKPVYIIIERGMIFVDHHEMTVLNELILNEDYQPDESYDTSDGVDYFSSSKYADWIICGLLSIVNTSK